MSVLEVLTEHPTCEMVRYLTRFGIAAIRDKITRIEAKRDQALRSAGEAAQNDPNAYHDNFEYEESMRQQEMLSRQMRSLWEVIQGAGVAPEPADNETVAIGHHVTIWGGDEASEEEYILCGDGEGALFENACSASSPLGRTLLGMRRGETRTVSLAARSFEVRVVDIRVADENDFRIAST